MWYRNAQRPLWRRRVRRGFGFGQGFGYGAGFDRFGYPAGPVVEADEREYMRRRAEALESELAETRRVMDEMGKAEKE